MDTIAAIASGMTASGIGIIRISGPEAVRILADIFRPRNLRHPVSSWKPCTVHYGHVMDEDRVIDECLVFYMKGPHTYTTEDTVEIDCHGGPFVMRQILERAFRAGARPAEPGEFTKRAFLGGRIDLTEAEAVMDVISAKSGEALTSSLRQLSGSVKEEISALRTVILDELAFLEAALDDPEHYSLDGFPEELLRKLAPVRARLAKLIDSFSEGRILREGIRTVILGKPNAGKSSLLNLLAGEERAIVTDIEGTTRDVLEESVRMGELVLNLTDTAGIRRSGDVIEQIGVSRAKDAAERADLLLAVLDSSRPLDENDREILALLNGRKAIVLYNKSDLSPAFSTDELRAYTDAPVVCFSAKSGEGIPELEAEVRSLFYSGTLKLNEEVFLTNIRHKNEAEAALTSLDLVEAGIRDGFPEDFYSIDLMDAYTHLGAIIGEAVEDDLVDTIFSKFCMGK